MANIQVIEGDALTEIPKLKDRFQLCYFDPPFNTKKHRGDYADYWKTPQDYIKWLRPYVEAIDGVLTSTGAMILHLDYRSVHYARVMCDEIFGYKNMLREIVWNYNAGGAGASKPAQKHDTLLWYVKDPKTYFYKLQYEPYATPNVQGREGFNNKGRMITDVWNISIISTTGKERVGYSSQKPLRLLRRIIECFVAPGGRILDPMCGSGTTGIAALELNYDVTLIDENPKAIDVTKKRIHDFNPNLQIT